MINKQDVLMGLVCCSESSGYGCNWCPYGGECHETTLSGCKHLCADALELLEKQEPKLVQNNRTSFNPNYEEGDCPSCGERITTNSHLKPTQYCKYCGQAVKWND